MCGGGCNVSIQFTSEAEYQVGMSISLVSVLSVEIIMINCLMSETKKLSQPDESNVHFFTNLSTQLAPHPTFTKYFSLQIDVFDMPLILNTYCMHAYLLVPFHEQLYDSVTKSLYILCPSLITGITPAQTSPHNILHHVSIHSLQNSFRLHVQTKLSNIFWFTIFPDSTKPKLLLQLLLTTNWVF